MISRDEYRKALGEEADKLSSQEIEELKDRQEKLADALFDIMFYQNKSQDTARGPKKGK